MAFLWHRMQASFVHSQQSVGLLNVAAPHTAAVLTINFFVGYFSRVTLSSFWACFLSDIFVVV